MRKETIISTLAKCMDLIYKGPIRIFTDKVIHPAFEQLPLAAKDQAMEELVQKFKNYFEKINVRIIDVSKEKYSFNADIRILFTLQFDIPIKIILYYHEADDNLEYNIYPNYSMVEEDSSLSYLPSPERLFKKVIDKTLGYIPNALTYDQAIKLEKAVNDEFIQIKKDLDTFDIEKQVKAVVNMMSGDIDSSNFIELTDLDENCSSRKKFSLLEFLRSQVVDEDDTSFSHSLEYSCKGIWDKLWHMQSSFNTDVSPVFCDQDIPLPLANFKTLFKKFIQRFRKNFSIKSVYDRVFGCNLYLTDFPVTIEIYYVNSHTSDKFFFGAFLKKDFRSDSSLVNSLKKIILDVFGEIPQSINFQQQQKLQDRVIEEWEKIKKQLVDFDVEKQVKEIVQEMANSDLNSKLISLDDLDESRLPNEKSIRDICKKFFHNWYGPLEGYRINEDNFLEEANLPLASYKEVVDKIISAYKNNFKIEILDSYSSYSLCSVRFQINDFDIPLIVDLRFYLTTPDTLFINTFLDTQTVAKTTVPYNAMKPFKLVIAKILNCDIDAIPEFVSTEDADKIYDAIQYNLEKVKKALDKFDLRRQIENIVDSFMNDSQLISFDDLSEE